MNSSKLETVISFTMGEWIALGSNGLLVFLSHSIGIIDLGFTDPQEFFFMGSVNLYGENSFSLTSN